MEPSTFWYALCVVILFLKMFALSSYQGFCRLSRLIFVNPEDSQFFKKVSAKEELPQVQKAAKAWRNDLENIPIFLGLGIAYILVDASSNAAILAFPIFTIARILHTLTYLLSLQPWRTISYMIGILCLFVMAWNITFVLVSNLI